ncbi:MAG: DUF3467 domain-containing protein [Candidatus ainarchaeum sp.]|nr:DUF3467 domain-containing protein [Candidatus ainarchaeum sp.]
MPRKASKVKEPQLPELVHVRDPDYREVYATGALGVFDSPGGFHITFYSPNRKLETLGREGPQVVEVSHKVKIIVTPATLKHVLLWLTKSLEEYESKFGKLQEPILPTRTSIIGAHPPETMYG